MNRQVLRQFFGLGSEPWKKAEFQAVFYFHNCSTTQQVTGDIGMISPRLLLVLFVTCWLAQSHALTSFVSSKGLHISDLTYSLTEGINVDIEQPIAAIRIGVMIGHAWPQDLEGNSISSVNNWSFII